MQNSRNGEEQEDDHHPDESKKLQENDEQKSSSEGSNGSSPVCIVSRYDKVSCRICNDAICEGMEMFAFTSNPQDEGGKTILCWGHKYCYHKYSNGTEIPPPPPVCRHWTRLGRCPSLEVGMCAFRHDPADRGSFSCGKKKWGGKRRLVRNDHKNNVFRSFLMQTYTLEYLIQPELVILDVAGGKGELSWELINLMGAKNSVVVDPRPLRLNSMIRNWNKGLYEPKRTGPVFSKWFPNCEDGCRYRTPQIPQHIRCFFDSPNFIQLSQLPNNNNNNNKKSNNWNEVTKWFQSELNHARRVKWTTRGLQHENDNPNHPLEENEDAVSEKNAILGKEVVDPLVVSNMLQKCGLIIGFHPDQAAGDIAAYATAQGIPWCIVPCCVYSDIFTARRLSNGSIVKTHHQLVQWLCETYPEAKVRTLGLEGKNQVVYTLPKTT